MNRQIFAIALLLAISGQPLGANAASKPDNNRTHQVRKQTSQPMLSKVAAKRVSIASSSLSTQTNQGIQSAPAMGNTPNNLLEPVDVNTKMPVIPLAAVRPVDMDDMSLSEAKEALQLLLKAQEKMMSQMQILQTRIEKTEQLEQTNQKALQGTSEKLSNDASLLQSVARRVTLMGYVESGYRAYSHGSRDEEYLGANGKSGNDFSARRVVLRPRMNFNDKASWYGELEQGKRMRVMPAV